MLNILLEARKNGLKYEDSHNEDTAFATVQESEIHKRKLDKVDITDEEIASQGFGFFFAGYEAVSSTMAFMSYELAVNSDIQARLIEEVDTTRNSCDDQITYEALNSMKYMDMVVSETLRKWPQNVVINRICNKPFTIEPKYPDEKPLVLEKDTVLWIPLFAVLRDPKFFPDPEKFDPERFSLENRKNIVQGSFIPFGSGPRNCIGSRLAILETKAVFYHLLCQFEVVPVEKTQIPIQMRKGKMPVIADKGVWVGLKRRFEKIHS
ncbi:cytochrome P450 9e2-like [Zophobas morio]|uniref:cytochrome P450 9e2-like n=1 Tax=Zophobas morio TaxID=2755281 RepID=UPI0030827821